MEEYEYCCLIKMCNRFCCYVEWIITTARLGRTFFFIIYRIIIIVIKDYAREDTRIIIL